MNAGDTVYLITYYYGEPSSVKQTTVTKVTPSGQVVLANGARYKNGREIGTSGWSTHTEMTADAEEIKRALGVVKHKRLAADLRNCDWKALPLETLEAVKALLDEAAK